MVSGDWQEVVDLSYGAYRSCYYITESALSRILLNILYHLLGDVRNGLSAGDVISLPPRMLSTALSASHSSRLGIVLLSYHRLGLSGLLNPPTRFMYCLYSVFFSLLTPHTLLPLTLVFFVVVNPAKPIILRISAVSGSSSITIASTPFVVGTIDALAPFVFGVGASFEG